MKKITNGKISPVTSDDKAKTLNFLEVSIHLNRGRGAICALQQMAFLGLFHSEKSMLTSSQELAAKRNPNADEKNQYKLRKLLYRIDVDEARPAVDAASLIFAHAVLDSVLHRLCVISSEVAVHSILPYKERVSNDHDAGETINAKTRYCAVFGHPIAHSASPAMQNAGLAALGLNWRYLAFDVHPDHLRPAIEGAKLMGLIGLNLTVPHKLLALDMVDVVDEQARMWGAVNTIVFEMRTPSGQWIPLGAHEAPLSQEVRSKGFNTDADAIVQALKEAFALESLRGASVLLLGAGGAARAAALRLVREGLSHLYLVNRTQARAADLAADLAKSCPGVVTVQGYPGKTVDLVINATSLGLKADDPLPIDLQWLQKCRPRYVYDMIYRPMETGLLRAAKKAGCRTANGAGMLLHQGTRALELWTGRPAPVEVMRAALEKNLYG